MRKVIRITENELQKIISKIINEQPRGIVGRARTAVEDIASYFKGSRGAVITFEEAKSLFTKFPKFIDEIDNIVVPALNSKNVKSLDELTAKVYHQFNTVQGLGENEAKEATKNFLNAYSQKKGYNSYKEIKNMIGKPQNMGSVGQSFLNSFKDFDTWIQALNTKGNMSGWKFHVFADTFDDTAFVYDKVAEICKKWGAGLKLGGGKMFQRSIGTPGTLQHGKGVTIYLPSSMVANGQQKNFLSELESALSDYKKSGQISGDQMISSKIGYRYELSQPVDPRKGVDMSEYRTLYKSNEGGSHNLPNNPDLFSSKQNQMNSQTQVVKKTLPDKFSGNRISNRSFGPETSWLPLVDFTDIKNAKNMQDYNKTIAKAIQTGDFRYVSSRGFEKFGIPNFREYLQNNIAKVIEVNPETGRWSVIFK